MDGELFCLGGDITTGGDDDKRVCLAVRVLKIEPAEEYRRGRSDALAESHFLACPCYNWGVLICVFGSRWDGGRNRPHDFR